MVPGNLRTPGELLSLIFKTFKFISRNKNFLWWGSTLGLQLPLPVIITDTKTSLLLTAKNPQLWISMQFADYSFQLLYKDPLLLTYATSLPCCSTASQMEKPFGEALFCLHNLLPRLLGAVLKGIFPPKAATPVKKNKKKNPQLFELQRGGVTAQSYSVCFQGMQPCEPWPGVYA